MTEASKQAREAADLQVDSGMDAETVATAEWAWANLPVGPRKWTSLPTHEKALVCHIIARIRADCEAKQTAAVREAVEACAKVAASYPSAACMRESTGEKIATAIRAQLKDNSRDD